MDNKLSLQFEIFFTGTLSPQNEEGIIQLDQILSLISYKDIYKNIKGQTIAPAYIEKKFEDIPGLKRAFLVGDMKPYDTLLIVPVRAMKIILLKKQSLKIN